MATEVRELDDDVLVDDVDQNAESDQEVAPERRAFTTNELIVRQTALKCASEFAASRPELKSGDVLTIARNFQRWVLYGDA